MRADLLKLFGDRNIEIKHATEAEVDKSVAVFVKNFEKRYTVVSKNRTKWWLIASLLLTLVGFAIAWLLILRFNF